MIGPPPIGGSPSALPPDSDSRREVLIDIFGRCFIWALEEAQVGCRKLVESREARKSLGTIKAAAYEAVEGLPDDSRQIAYSYARRVAERFGRNVLGILSSEGISLMYGDNHAIRFRIVAEIVDRIEEAIQIEEVLNRGSQKALGSYWGHWLFEFGKLKE